MAISQHRFQQQAGADQPVAIGQQRFGQLELLQIATAALFATQTLDRGLGIGACNTRGGTRIAQALHLAEQQMAQMVAICAEQLRQRGANLPAFAGGPQCIGDQRQRAAGHGRLQARADRFARCHAFEGQQQHQHAGQKRHADTVVHLRQQPKPKAKQRQQGHTDAGAVHRQMREQGGQQQADEGAGHAQRAKAEGAAEIRFEHDGGGHRNPEAVRDLLPALEGDGQRQTHAATQRVPEGDRRQVKICAQRGPGRGRAQRRRQPRFGQLRLDFATAAGPVRVADQRA